MFIRIAKCGPNSKRKFESGGASFLLQHVHPKLAFFYTYKTHVYNARDTEPYKRGV